MQKELKQQSTPNHHAQDVKGTVDYAVSKLPESMNTTFFVETQPYPQCSINFTIDDKGRPKSVSYKGPPSDTSLLKDPCEDEARTALGYEIYKKFICTTFDLKNSNGSNERSFSFRGRQYQLLTKHGWTQLFDQVTDNLNKYQRDYHGLLCFKDGNTQNYVIDNQLILQVGDFLSVLFARIIDPTTNIFYWLPSKQVDESSLLSLTSSIEENEWNDRTKFFVACNADFLWCCYAYWQHFSYLPTRISPSPLMKNSFKIMSNTDVREHNLGRYNQLLRHGESQSYHGCVVYDAL